MQDLTQAEATTWERAINLMLTKLGTDLSNHRILADPWYRKSQSMARTWVNILRSGRRTAGNGRRRAPSTWSAASTAMALALARRAYQQRTRTGWRRWASDRSQEISRWPTKFRTLRSPSCDADDLADARPRSPTAA